MCVNFLCLILSIVFSITQRCIFDINAIWCSVIVGFLLQNYKFDIDQINANTQEKNYKISTKGQKNLKLLSIDKKLRVTLIVKHNIRQKSEYSTKINPM